MTYLDSHPSYRELSVDQHLRLITPDLAHAPESLLWVESPNVIQYMGADFSEPSLEKEKERLHEILENADEYSWMIERDRKVIGNVCINSIAETTEKFGVKAGNLTILIGEKDAWGKGIATATCSAVLRWAFEEAGFEAMGARALQENVASIKTLQKLGFEDIGSEPYEGLVHNKPSLWRNFRKNPE